MSSSSGTVSSAEPLPAGVSYAQGTCPNPIYPGVPQLDLGPEFVCGVLTVPENRQRPEGPGIELAVAIAPAVSETPKPDPLLYLTGGPGGSALLAAQRAVADGWNAERDVIFFDQRGTWKSDPLLACPEIDAFQVEALGLDSSAEATLTAASTATRTCRDRLAGEGWDPASYNTLENSADVADLRLALGVDEWNLYGVSYGTDLAQQTVRDHPEGIRAVVLDSLVPPQDNIFDGFWPSAADGYRALFDACAAQPECAAAYPNVESDFQSLVADLAASPRSVTVTAADGSSATVLIDGYKVANMVAVASLAPGLIVDLPRIIDDLAHGDGSLAAQRLLGGVPPPGVTGYGLALGVFCAEMAPHSSPDQVAAAAEAVLPQFPESVRRLAPQAFSIFSDCAAWDVPDISAQANQALNGATIPALLVSGGLDGVTAPARAVSAAQGFAGARLLTFPDAAHDVMLWSPHCGVAVMNSFLDSLDDPDDSCVSGLQPAPFTVG